jgi:hypothetical protein
MIKVFRRVQLGATMIEATRAAAPRYEVLEHAQPCDSDSTGLESRVRVCVCVCVCGTRVGEFGPGTTTYVEPTPRVTMTTSPAVATTLAQTTQPAAAAESGASARLGGWAMVLPLTILINDSVDQHTV